MSVHEETRFASALSTLAESARAEDQVCERVLDGLGERRADLAAVFVSHHHGDAIEHLGPRLRERTGAEVIVGCTGESIIGSGREVEQEPALSLWCAHLPGTELRPFHVSASAGPDGRVAFSRMPEVRDPENAHVLLFGEPFSFPMDEYLKRLNGELPGVPAVGGMASGGMGPGQNLLVHSEGILDAGALGVVLEGGIEVRSVVSQGCKPVGRPWVVTACEDNLLKALGGRPAAEVLMGTLGELPEDDQKRFQRQPIIGLAIDASKSTFRAGDFLVRGVMGIEQEQKAVVVADVLRAGQTVQFMLRDADSADADLVDMMATQGGGALELGGRRHAAGALLFSCNGRGSRLFSGPNHDVNCVQTGLANDVPLAGFFAMGEIGPVGGSNFLHGYTASVVVFRPTE